MKNSTGVKPELEKEIDYVIQVLGSGNLYHINSSDLEELDKETKNFVLLSTGGDTTAKNIDRRSTFVKKGKEEPISKLSVEASHQHPLVKEILPDICNWNFPIFKLFKKSKGSPLFYMAYALFVHHDLINKFSIPEKKLVAWLKKMEEGYLSQNTYHNSTHASDVAQTFNFFITRGGLASCLTESDIFAGFFF